MLIKELLPSDRYAAIKSHFNACSDAEAIDLLYAHGDQYCATAAAREGLMADMQKVYLKHKAFSQIERGVQSIFKRIFP